MRGFREGLKGRKESKNICKDIWVLLHGCINAKNYILNMNMDPEVQSLNKTWDGKYIRVIHTCKISTIYSSKIY